MLDKIAELEQLSRKLEPLALERDHWNKAAQGYADQFLDDFNPKHTFVISEDMGRDIRDYPIEDDGKPIEEILECLKKNVDTPNLNPASGGHFGYIPGGGVFTTALGDYLAAVTNRYAGIFFACPGGVRMENMLLRWMCSMVGYPEDALGNLTSGGSMANLSAIATARDFKGIKARDIEKCVVYMTSQLHHCIQKSLRIVGMGECIVRYIPMDKNFRMIPDRLNRQIDIDLKDGLIPFMVFASAGTTDTGSIDPLEAIGNIANEKELWYHIDAAYGGFFMMSESLKPAFKGTELSDSMAIDPHKGLFLSYGIGAILIKNTSALHQTHHYTANYMQDAFTLDEDPSPADLSPELTKHFRGLRMWISLQLLGMAPFRAALEEKVVLCSYFYQEIQKLGFEVGPEPELSIAIFRYVPSAKDPNSYNLALIEQLKKDGRIFLSSTTIDEIVWLRFAVLSFRTHLEQVRLALKLLEEFTASD
ncbi:MAG: aspartate aminotransferase family protein [Flavobacteriaceae bacterium]